MMNVSLLGTSGTLPLPGRNLASCYVTTEAGSILIDAGEGTQVAIHKYKKSAKNIDIILITHCHLDHVGGLPGVLQAIANTKRRKPVMLVGPEGVAARLAATLEFVNDLPFKVNVVELHRGSHKPISFGNTEIIPFLVNHTVLCFGYNILIKRNPKFLVEEAEKLFVQPEQYQDLIDGKCVVTRAGVVSPRDVLGPRRNGIKMSYCVDTRPTRKICDAVRHADLFICEGMYYDDTKYDKALQNKHLMWEEAISLAEKAKVSKVWLTHFSPTVYSQKSKHVENPCSADVTIGYDGLQCTLTYQSE